jgi:MerR family transcriptional regulator, light-induced transcriptional regulator
MSASNQTPTYNLKAVVQETGLKPDTLRAWERRYGLPQPKRTGGGHRLYSQHDIDMLKWLVARQDEGLSISRAVELWQNLEQEGENPFTTPIHPAPVQMPVIPQPPPPMVGNAITELRRSWVAACLAFDERTAENILAQASAIYPLETVCFELLQKGLAHMGEGWYKNEISVQQEHFASALAIRRLDTLVAAMPPPTRPGRILVACPPEEEHTFSPLLLTLLLRRNGWDVLYLGANVPIQRLEITLATARPQLVILAAQQLHTAATLLEMAQPLQQERVPLAFGGAVFNYLPGLRSRIPGYFLGDRLDVVTQVVEQLLIMPRSLTLPLVTPELPAPYQQALSCYRENQGLIEAQVWHTLKDKEIAHSRVANANLKLGQGLIAALSLGNIEFLGTTIAWVEGLIFNHQFSIEQLYLYLRFYYQAAQNQLDERGQLIIDWLNQISVEPGRGER